MAFIETTRSPIRIPTLDDLNDPDTQLPMWVNVSVKVGENVRNIKSVDTLWVQFVLKNIFDAPGMFRIPKPLKVDGIYGDNTKAWITHFQTNRRAQSFSQGDTVFLPVHPDGAVSRMPLGDFDVKRGFTAYRMNKALAVINPFLFFTLTQNAASNQSLEAFIKLAMQQAA